MNYIDILFGVAIGYLIGVGYGYLWRMIKEEIKSKGEEE